MYRTLLTCTQHVVAAWPAGCIRVLQVIRLYFLLQLLRRVSDIACILRRELILHTTSRLPLDSELPTRHRSGEHNDGGKLKREA